MSFPKVDGRTNLTGTINNPLAFNPPTKSPVADTAVVPKDEFVLKVAAAPVPAAPPPAGGRGTIGFDFDNPNAMEIAISILENKDVPVRDKVSYMAAHANYYNNTSSSNDGHKEFIEKLFTQAMESDNPDVFYAGFNAVSILEGDEAAKLQKRFILSYLKHRGTPGDAIGGDTRLEALYETAVQKFRNLVYVKADPKMAGRKTGLPVLKADEFADALKLIYARIPNFDPEEISNSEFFILLYAAFLEKRSDLSANVVKEALIFINSNISLDDKTLIMNHLAMMYQDAGPALKDAIIQIFEATRKSADEKLFQAGFDAALNTLNDPGKGEMTKFILTFAKYINTVPSINISTQPELFTIFEKAITKFATENGLPVQTYPTSGSPSITINEIKTAIATLVTNPYMTTLIEEANGTVLSAILLMAILKTRDDMADFISQAIPKFIIEKDMTKEDAASVMKMIAAFGNDPASSPKQKEVVGKVFETLRDSKSPVAYYAGLVASMGLAEYNLLTLKGYLKHYDTYLAATDEQSRKVAVDSDIRETFAIGVIYFANKVPAKAKPFIDSLVKLWTLHPEETALWNSIVDLSNKTGDCEENPVDDEKVVAAAAAVAIPLAPLPAPALQPLPPPYSPAVSGTAPAATPPAFPPLPAISGVPPAPPPPAAPPVPTISYSLAVTRAFDNAFNALPEDKKRGVAYSVAGYIGRPNSSRPVVIPSATPGGSPTTSVEDFYDFDKAKFQHELLDKFVESTTEIKEELLRGLKGGGYSRSRNTDVADEYIADLTYLKLFKQSDVRTDAITDSMISSYYSGDRMDRFVNYLTDINAVEWRDLTHDFLTDLNGISYNSKSPALMFGVPRLEEIEEAAAKAIDPVVVSQCNKTIEILKREKDKHTSFIAVSAGGGGLALNRVRGEDKFSRQAPIVDVSLGKVSKEDSSGVRNMYGAYGEFLGVLGGGLFAGKKVRITNDLKLNANLNLGIFRSQAAETDRNDRPVTFVSADPERNGWNTNSVDVETKLLAGKLALGVGAEYRLFGPIFLNAYLKGGGFAGAITDVDSNGNSVCLESVDTSGNPTPNGRCRTNEAAFGTAYSLGLNVTGYLPEFWK